MRHTKYHASYGYVTGEGIGDFFRKIQPFVTPVVSKIAKAGMKAAGDKIGSKIADRIAPKPQLPQVTRADILRDLRLNDKDLSQLGFGRKKKIRGSGLRVLT